MFEPKTLPEQLLFATVKIIGKRNDGKISQGTGFFYLDENNILCLITNKHVLADVTEITFRLHLTQDDKSSCSIHEVTVPVNALKVIGHPKDEVDLLAICINPVFEHVNQQLGNSGKKVFFRNFDNKTICDDAKLAENLQVTDRVLMIGYPIGIGDDANNLPIIRQGILASQPSIDFNGQPSGMLDIACFPGSSGSPIIHYETGNFVDKRGTTHVGSSRFYFLGVQKSGPCQDTDIPTVVPRAQGFFSGAAKVRQMVHIAEYVKAKEVLVLSAHVLDDVQRNQHRASAAP